MRNKTLEFHTSSDVHLDQFETTRDVAALAFALQNTRGKDASTEEVALLRRWYEFTKKNSTMLHWVLDGLAEIDVDAHGIVRTAMLFGQPNDPTPD